MKLYAHHAAAVLAAACFACAVPGALARQLPPPNADRAARGPRR